MLRFKKLSLQLIAQFKDNLQLNVLTLHHTIKKFIKPNDLNWGEENAYKMFKNKIFNVSNTIIGSCSSEYFVLTFEHICIALNCFGSVMHFLKSLI